MEICVPTGVMLAWEEVNDRVCGVKQNAGWLGWGGLGDEANRVSISSRCAGWRVPRTSSGGWCRTSEAQALMQNLWGQLGIQTHGVLMQLGILFGFSLSALKWSFVCVRQVR